MFGICWTCRPVVTISSVEEREEEDGWEVISTQDSGGVSYCQGGGKGGNVPSFRNRVTPDD